MLEFFRSFVCFLQCWPFVQNGLFFGGWRKINQLKQNSIRFNILNEPWKFHKFFVVKKIGRVSDGVELGWNISKLSFYQYNQFKRFMIRDIYSLYM